MRREVDFDRRDGHEPLRYRVEVRAGARVLAGTRGADPIDRAVVRVERLHGGLGLVAEAEPRRAHAFELLGRQVGHVDVQDGVGRQRVRDVALDELADELGGRREVLAAVQHQRHRDRRDTEEPAFHRRGDGAGVQHVVAEIGAVD